MIRPTIPEGLGPFYRVLAEIEREKAKERRGHLRLIIETANEIEREEPPAPQFREGVEIMRGMTYIEEGGIQ